MTRTAAPTIALVAADATVLVAARPDVDRLLAGLAHLPGWVGRDGADGVVASLSSAGLWLAAAWLAIGLLAAAATRLPGAAGAVGAALARLVLPRAVRALLAGSAGLGVLLAPAAAGAAGASPPPAAATPAPPAGALPTPSRPVAPTAPAAALPTPSWPVDPAGAQSKPLPAPGWPVRPPARPEPRSRGTAVTVQRGDSLWVIAARRLPHATAAQVAHAWPRWYAANRRVVGPDPSRIVPGQLLHAPAATEEDRP